MEIQNIRRTRLKQWIADKFPGKRGQSAFIENIAARSGTEINQGELSALLSGKKSFGEKKARNMERLSGMGDKWLDGEPQAKVPAEDAANAERDPRAEILATYFYWLTEPEKKKLLLEVKAKADGNKLVLKQLSGKLSPPPDEYVDKALNHSSKRRRKYGRNV